MQEKILIMGDVHGRWGALNQIINRKQPNKIFVCGDFGYWPDWPNVDIKNIKNYNTKIYWCDGNHEDHIALSKLENNEIAPNIFYQPRGSYITLDDGRNILFMGGADSIDKYSRTPALDWFVEEIISSKDIDKALSLNIKVDIVISHTCPSLFNILSFIKNRYIVDKNSDPSCEWLNIILKEFKPDLWYFGHWHQYIKSQYKNTRWECLNYVPHERCYIELRG